MAETAAAKKLEIKCRRMRVSFVKVFRAEAFRGSGRGVSEESGQKAFSLNVLIPKDTKEGKDLHEEIEDAIDEAMDAQWGRDTPPSSRRIRRRSAPPWSVRTGKSA